MSKRTAKSLAKKLTHIDNQIAREFLRKNHIPDDAKVDRLDAQKTQLIKEAHSKNGLKMVNIPVADGSAIYYQTKRTTRQATFELLYGGADCYISPWGCVVSIPCDRADRLLSSFTPDLVN